MEGESREVYGFELGFITKNLREPNTWHGIEARSLNSLVPVLG